MRKLLTASTLFLILAAQVGYCSSTITPRLQMSVPGVGTSGPSYATQINNDFTIIDSSVAVLYSSNTFTSTNTFNSALVLGYGGSNLCVGTDSNSKLVTQQCTATSISGSAMAVYLDGVQVSSPTGVLKYFSNDFGAVLQGGATAYVTLNPNTTDFIHNQASLQSNTTAYPMFLYVGSSGTIPSINGTGLTYSTATITSSVTVSGNAVFSGTSTFTGRISTSPVSGTGFGSSGMALESQGTGSAPTWTFANMVPQSSTFTIFAATSTSVAASWVNTGISKTVTPNSAHSGFLLIFSGNLRTSAANGNQAELAIFNGSSNLCLGSGNDRGCSYVAMGTTADSLDVPASFALTTCPSTTSAVTFTVKMQTNGSGTTTITNQSTYGNLIVVELGPNGMCP